MSNEIAVLPPKETALTVYSASNGLDPYLAQIRAEIDSFVPDVSTKKGRDAIASIAYKVAKSKTALDNLGKDLVAELKDVPRKIDAERKRMRDTLDLWKDEVRKPLTDFELAEEARVAGHKAKIQALIDIGNFMIGGEPQPFGMLFSELELIKVDASFEEFEAQAHREKEAAKSRLDQAFAEHQKRAAEQAELEKLRAEAAAREQKEREERIAREAAENARIAAEKAAADERQRLADEQARKDMEAQQALARAEREKLEAENERLRQQQAAEKAAAQAKQDAIDAAARAEADKQAAIDVERKRQADAAEAERKAAEQREKNKAHAKKINNEALQDLMAAGLSEECAKQAVTAIAKGAVRNIQINY